MQDEELVRDHPFLFHMAEDGSWPSLQELGLLTTSELLSLYGYAGQGREEIEGNWRKVSVTLHQPPRPDLVVRDQLVMPPCELKTCLPPGLTPHDWYRLVNHRIFFWTTEPDLAIFLAAGSYRNSPHLVLQVCTAELLRAHRTRVTLTPFNTGSTIRKDYSGRPLARGPDTFERIGDYKKGWVRELVVEGGLRDIRSLVVKASRRVARGRSFTEAKSNCVELEKLWERPE